MGVDKYWRVVLRVGRDDHRFVNLGIVGRKEEERRKEKREGGRKVERMEKGRKEGGKFRTPECL